MSSLSLSSLVWDDFLQALLYHGAAPQHPQLGTAHSSCQGSRGTQVPQLLSLTQEAQPYPTKFLVPCCPYQPCQRRMEGSVPRALPLPLPAWQSSWPPQQEQDLDSVGDAKAAHSQLHSSTCRWHGYTLLSQAALHSCSRAW